MRAPTSCGRPVPVAEVQIMSADGESQARRGEVGELWARGPMVAKGYWRNPEATAATFVDGWVRTGDLARMDEEDRKSVVWGKSVSVRVDFGGRRIIKKKKNNHYRLYDQRVHA